VSTAIQVEKLGRRYGARWAIKDLSFSAAPGEILGFLGPNGAGKTTTVRILTGQIAPTEGTARVAGLDVVRDRKALGARIGVTFEQQNLYERLTVRENLDFFARVAGAPAGRVDELMKRFAISDRAGDGVATLSRGLRQRIVLARALLGEPKVLFLDEPTAGLDPHAAREVRAWIREIGATTFLTTHDMEEAAEICDRVAIVDRGALVTLDTPRALVERISPPRLEVTREDGSTALLPVEPNEAADELARLKPIKEIRERSSNLADVFLQLTGRPLD